jgi:hypothetical protein
MRRTATHRPKNTEYRRAGRKTSLLIKKGEHKNEK